MFLGDKIKCKNIFGTLKNPDGNCKRFTEISAVYTNKLLPQRDVPIKQIVVWDSKNPNYRLPRMNLCDRPVLLDDSYNPRNVREVLYESLSLPREGEMNYIIKELPFLMEISTAFIICFEKFSIWYGNEGCENKKFALTLDPICLGNEKYHYIAGRKGYYLFDHESKSYYCIDFHWSHIFQKHNDNFEEYKKKMEECEEDYKKCTIEFKKMRKEDPENNDGIKEIRNKVQLCLQKKKECEENWKEKELEYINKIKKKLENIEKNPGSFIARAKMLGMK